MEKRKQVQFWCPEGLLAKLDAQAAAGRRSRTQQLLLLIDESPEAEPPRKSTAIREAAALSVVLEGESVTGGGVAGAE